MLTVKSPPPRRSIEVYLFPLKEQETRLLASALHLTLMISVSSLGELGKFAKGGATSLYGSKSGPSLDGRQDYLTSSRLFK